MTFLSTSAVSVSVPQLPPALSGLSFTKSGNGRIPNPSLNRIDSDFSLTPSPLLSS